MNIKRILKGAGIRGSYGTMGAAAVTLVQDGEMNFIVDTGHFGNREILVARLKENGLSPSDIDAVVLTHLHWDHCLNVDLFQKSKIILGEKEFKYGTLSGVEDNITEKFKDYLNSMNIVLVGEGYKITSNVTVIDLPGHTPEHIGVLAKDGRSLTVIAGDAIPNFRSYKRGIPDLIFYNKQLAIESIKKIKDINPNVIIPGHDSPFNNNGYLERDQIDILLRGEHEEDIVVNIGKVVAEGPVIYNG